MYKRCSTSIFGLYCLLPLCSSLSPSSVSLATPLSACVCFSACVLRLLSLAVAAAGSSSCPQHDQILNLLDICLDVGESPANSCLALDHVFEWFKHCSPCSRGAHCNLPLIGGLCLQFRKICRRVANQVVKSCRLALPLGRLPCSFSMCFCMTLRIDLALLTPASLFHQQHMSN